jgi:undecaprenyl pyrophosphate phosphatase UppP
MDAISSTGPQAEIARLEERIEQLAAKIENCHKLMLAARIAVAFGGVLVAALVTGVLYADPVLMITAIAAVLGGIVLLGSNSSTASEAREQMEEAELQRDEWIGALQLRDLGPRALH